MAAVGLICVGAVLLLKTSCCWGGAEPGRYRYLAGVTGRALGRFFRSDQRRESVAPAKGDTQESMVSSTSD